MMGGQKATASDGALIVQSSGDTIVNVSNVDMRAVIEAMADQLPKFAAVASEIVEKRLSAFEEKIIKRFEQSETSSIQAFADPDFQYLLGRAQHAYARSGDELTADVLIDLIAHRSIQTERTRLTLSLNDAVERSAYLTPNEFAELSLAFLLRYTKRTDITNFEKLVIYLRDNAGRIVPEVSRSESSYNYIAAQSCGSIQITRASLMDILTKSYGGVLSLGTDRERFAETLGDDFPKLYPDVVGPCLHDQSKLQAMAIDKSSLESFLKQRGLEGKTGQIWDLHSQSFMQEQQFIEKALPLYPEVRELFAVWNDTQMHRLTLTSVGQAIGFANLKRLCGVEADLGIWID
ncbi:hypothetical protein CN138_37280 [Sinorhizobium meliloti]|uniref:LPO_1073/Vpar_1526 family protein n=1 Tax=Rhizobium meliloti TaxID=382 RepID=UPI000FD2803B|nr:LPO_1073/Vpar_1526 family protein [Sinorhizobium meliloti]RVK16196.1 hypothetical protein CN164_04330 [Sinorhizobium meliloti]RVL42801.1 hypothetical protein CN145_33310 [Sinorhizobium meliloti]RVL57618.1 hypothetical protein CN138_37280 [Sinorhizobium meliloti]RVQ37325.1 hypothetical protein CN068_18135 [Sinorhizobium meliloti]WQO40690.1 LPO_1073/Vpar_1526 family protein [Sinorhizobium meliloti]